MVGEGVGVRTGIGVCVGTTACLVIGVFAVIWEEVLSKNIEVASVIEPSMARMILSTITIMIRLLPARNSCRCHTEMGKLNLPIVWISISSRESILNKN